jgi:hypothetical protein
MSYKRLIHEYTKLNIEENNKPINKFSYKLITIDSNNIMYKSEINFIYKKVNYSIILLYNQYYPFRGPDKLTINGINIVKLYNIIMNKNKDILGNSCLCCKSLLCTANWSINKNINDLIKEILNVIDYKYLYIKRLLLRKIICKYTNQDLDFMEKYLL